MRRQKSTQKPLALCLCNIGKLPLAGFSLADLHTVDGLLRLGYEVHCVERVTAAGQCYDPLSNSMTDNTDYALSYISRLLPDFGLTREQYSFIDRDNQCHGTDWRQLNSAIKRAEFLLTLGDPVWFDELGECPTRAFIDTDPFFTQVAMEKGIGHPDSTASVIENYQWLFTEGMRYGKTGCAIPSGGREWISIPPAISTRLWEVQPPNRDAPLSTLMNWQSGSTVFWEKQGYGHKDREFARFIDLPRRVPDRQLEIALGGAAPRDKIKKHGWKLIDPISVTRTVSDYKRYIANSWADFGVAKHAYVKSRGGWFSDRSTCFMASGRPVMHQDTGCGDWLPTGEGVILFSDIDDIVNGVEELEKNYEVHALAARSLVEQFFDAERVLRSVIESF